jgi:hypothetical protein
MILSIAKEFTETPGPRAREEGEFSGEQFLEEYLLPRYENALKNQDYLTVDLDGAEGYATSFLEAAFGGLARIRDLDEVLRTLKIKADDEPYLAQEITAYIRDARK